MLPSSIALIVIILGMTMYFDNQSHTKSQITLANSISREISTNLSSYFASRVSEVQAYAKTPLLQSMEYDRSVPFLKSVKSQSQDYEKFIIGFPDGKFMNTVKGNPQLQGFCTHDDQSPTAKFKNISKRDYWKAIFKVDQSNPYITYTSNPMISYTTQAKQVVISSSIVTPEGKIVGLLGGSISWKRIQEVLHLEQIKIQKSLGTKSKFIIMAEDGTYWHHWNPKKLLHLKTDDNGNLIKDSSNENIVVRSRIQEEPEAIYQTVWQELKSGLSGHVKAVVEETPGYVFYSPIAGTGYSMGIFVPQDSLHTYDQTKYLILIIIFGIIILISILFSLYISRVITEPISLLNEKIRKFKDNQFTPVSEEFKIDELDQIATTFNEAYFDLATGQNDLKSSEERFKLAMEGSQDGLFDWNLETETIYLSDRWKQILGCYPDEILDEPDSLMKYIHPSDKERIMQALDDYIRGDLPHWHQQFMMVHKTGKTIHILARAISIRNNEGVVTRLVGTHVDISQQQLANEKVLKLNNELDQKVVERTKELQVAIQKSKEAELRAQEANDAKSEFLAVMSHEIRTPLNAIIGFSDISIDQDEFEEYQENTKLIKNSAHILLNLINDILDFSKITAGKLELESLPFNFKEFIHDVQKLMQHKQNETLLEFKVEVDPGLDNYFLGDTLRLTQILLNLLSNSFKFTTQGSIQVLASQDEQGICIEIIDTGMGMTQEQLSTLFDPFTQADSTISRKFGGTGLGMAICKNLVEMMQGQIQVKSQINQGTHFYIHLNLPSCDHPQPELTQKMDQDQDQEVQFNHVLIADDNPINQKVLSKILQKLDITFDIANNGYEAIDLVKDNPYDLVLMDVQMPGCDGLQASQTIRQLLKLPPQELPIIAVTANAQAEVKQSCLDSGMQGFLTKPIDMREVKALLTQPSQFF